MKSTKIFYLLVVYVLLQLGWWSYLLVKLNTELGNEKLRYLETLPQTEATMLQESRKKLNEKYLMVAGEGLVFLSLLGIGIYYARRSFRKEFQIALQQKNFMMSITHEFKSPIAGIRLSLETLLRRDVEKQQRDKILSRALLETDRINFLVENILTATRIEEQQIWIFSLLILIYQKPYQILWLYYSNLQSSHNFKLKIENNIHITADKNAIHSLILNLIENAQKYTPANSRY